MSLSIIHNASAAVANRLLSGSSDQVSRSVAKLSSGTRVIAARDDAAALSIGSRLTAEVASLSQAAVNANQAASMLQIADGAASQIDSILLRMKSLAVQAGSDQLADRERAMLDTEFQALSNELDRIAKDTTFNGRSLLQGDTETGIVYTIRSETTSGQLKLNETFLNLGDSFTQEDVNTGRVTYTHLGGTATTDQLVVSVADSTGKTIGTIAGELDPASFHTTEYLASTALDNINASAAYARGYTGQGVTVAVVDTGIDIDHVDFLDNLTLAVDLVDDTVDGLSATIGAGVFASGGGGDVTNVSLVSIGEGVDFFESGYVPQINITGTADAAAVTLTLGGVAYKATVNPNTGGASQVRQFTLTENNGTKTVQIGLTTDMSAGAITSGGTTLLQFTTPTSGNGNDDTVSPDQGHGTHVAGIVAAAKNGIGTHGVAYNADLIAVNVAEGGGGVDFNNVADAVDLAIANRADVINLSLGTPGFVTHTALQNAITRAVNAGIVVVAAAGNDSLDEAGFPANFAVSADAKGMLIAVVATDDNDALASFSNKAGVTQQFTLSAPGVGILSTTNDGSTGLNSGTSMAAPMVAGAVALMKEAAPQLSGTEIADMLFSTATDLGTAGVDSTFGQGLMDLDRATAPFLSMSVAIGNNSAVSGSLNVASDQTVSLDRDLLDFTQAYEGEVGIAKRNFNFKIGSGIATQDELAVNVGALTRNSLGLDSVVISSAAEADKASLAIDAALEELVSVRASIGASQNRLEIAINNLSTVFENTENARSQLIDLDIAAEMTQFTSLQILTQAGVAMVAQSNQQAQLVLRLLG